MKTIVPVAPVKFSPKALLLPWLVLAPLGFASAVTAVNRTEQATAAVAEKAAGALSPPQRIYSPELGYDLQYRVYQPAGFRPGLPTLYVTDGEAYLQYGQLEQLLNTEITAGRITPLVVVFVDSRDPDDLTKNRRHSQFMCNQQYAAFYRQQLIPAVSQHYQVSTQRQQRVILGLSFGAVNAACFGLLLPDVFEGIAMQSPGNSQHIGLLRKMYQQSQRLDLKMFLSIGTKKDNTAAGRKFHQTLLEKGYQVAYQEVPFGHDWQNWQPLLDDILQYYFPATIHAN
jgi:enterochelin esterase-like enzyme